MDAPAMNPLDRLIAATATATLAVCFILYLMGTYEDSFPVRFGAVYTGVFTNVFCRDYLRATLWAWMSGRQRTFYPQQQRGEGPT